ncbi:MAG: glycosyltransferase [Planctomycetes bacterium]|nr:glycosyltransferase [Planctomycetota bacterium]
MAARRPMVATDLPALGKHLQHQRNCLLARPDDPASLAAAIRRVRDEPETASRIARTASEDVRSHDWVCRAQKVIDFVQP